jgi:hypothetical protein
MRSRWRVAAFLAAVLGVLLAAWILGGEPEYREPAVERLITVEREPSPSAAPVESPVPVVEPGEEEVVVDAARGFMSIFATPPMTDTERAIWNREMAERCTPALAEMLHFTETDRLPVGNVVGASAVDVGETTASVAVTLNSEETLLVDLVTDGSRWQVADVREARE